VTLHNNGPAGPANVDVTVSISVPFDCDASPQGDQTSNDISLPVSVPVVISKTWSVTCDKESNHQITAGAVVSLDQAGWTDPDDSNDSGSGQDTLQVYAYTDVKVPSISVTAPGAVPPGTQFQITVSITIHNNGPYVGLQGEGGIGIAVPPDCAKTPTGYQLFNPIGLPVSQTMTQTRTWDVTCSATGLHQVIACGRAGPVTLHVRELSTYNAHINEHFTIEVGGGSPALHTGTSCSILGDPPEQCGNGIDDDQDGLIDEEPDLDADGLTDCDDDDDDGDGYKDINETIIGTDPWNDCPRNLLDDSWPPDFNNSRSVTIQDVLSIKPVFGKSAGTPGYDARRDLNLSNSITIQDVLAIKADFGHSCTG
jgi:hypothetical protein